MIEKIEHDFIKTSEGKNVTWLHLENPTELEIENVLDQYKMPRDFITSALDADEPSRYEQRNANGKDELNLFVFSYPFHDEGKNRMDNFYTMPISIVLGQGFIITTMLKHHNFFNQIRKKPENGQSMASYTWLMKVFWVISNKYIDHLKRIKSLLIEIEAQVVTSTDNTIMYDLIGINKGLIYFETAIQGNSRILKNIESESEEHGLNLSQSDMLRDVQVEHYQAMTLVIKYKEMVEKLTDMLSNVINNNINHVMKRLTSWTILLTIPTITSALWGMNVYLPFGDSEAGFIFVLIITAIITYIAYRWLKENQNM